MYYKGNIINVGEFNLNSTIKKYNLKKSSLLEEEKEEFNKIIENVKPNEVVKDNRLKNILNQICLKDNNLLFHELNSLDGLNIVYTLERDIYDNLYAKEILTNKIFPLFTPSHLNIDYELKSNKNDNIELIKHNGLTTYALYNPKYIVNNFSTVSDKELKKYKKESDIKHINKINNLYSKNIPNIGYQDIYNNDLKYIGTKHIEVLITYLMDKDKDLGIKLKMIYDNLLKSNYTILDLLNLEIDINNYLLLYNTNEMTLLSYLNSLKRKKNIEFFMDINKKNMLGLKQLDRISNIFLENQQTYPIDYQISIIEALSYLYFFEVYNNQDELTIEILNKSLFKRFINPILISIKNLKNNNSIDIDYDLNIKNINIEQLFEIIKQVKVKFLDSDKVKKLRLY